jgi:hypothetical protein
MIKHDWLVLLFAGVFVEAVAVQVVVKLPVVSVPSAFSIL